MNYSTVLIDLDDTILDFRAASENSLSLLLSDLGRPMKKGDFEHFERINSACWAELEKGLITRDALSEKRFRLFLSEIGIDHDPLDANIRFRLGLSKSAVLIDGALELCRSLSEICDIYLVTNGFTDTQTQRIEAAHIGQYFKKVFISQSIGYTKPDTGFLKAVFDDIGHDKESSAIILGDSLSSDIKCGRDYGIKTCWFNPHGREGNIKPDYIINRLSDFIPQVIKP